ncbi:MAG: hypothetical protein AAGU74_09460 [Bacillota bacterium]
MMKNTLLLRPENKAIQGGMPYVHTHESGLLMLKAFANKCDVRYKGGFVMGDGAMLNGQPIGPKKHGIDWKQPSPYLENLYGKETGNLEK